MVTKETVLQGSRLPHIGSIGVLLVITALTVALVVVGIQATDNDALTDQANTEPAAAVVPPGLVDDFSRSEDYALRHIPQTHVLDYRDDQGTRHLGG